MWYYHLLNIITPHNLPQSLNRKWVSRSASTLYSELACTELVECVEPKLLTSHFKLLSAEASAKANWTSVRYPLTAIPYPSITRPFLLPPPPFSIAGYCGLESFSIHNVHWPISTTQHLCSPIRCTLTAILPARSFAQAEAVAEVPIYRETRSAIKCARVCKKVKNFRIFSNVSHHFSNIFKYFRKFSIVFKRFQTQLAHLVWRPAKEILEKITILQ